MSCEICSSGEGKYCCPSCGRKTCSVPCVKEHKEKFGCSGVRPVPVAPEIGNEKYNEEMFVKDYNFLEEINSNVSNSERQTSVTAEDEERKRKMGMFKRIQRMAKLTEFRLLPSAFSRSKKNRTHIIKETDVGEKSEEPSEEPEKKSSRQARIAWTLDFVDYETGKLIGTRFDIPDDTEFLCLLDPRTKRAFLRNETRKPGVEKWREIGEEELRKNLGQILAGGRFFEYPQIGLILTNEESEE